MNVIKTGNNIFLIELSQNLDCTVGYFSDGKSRKVSECKYIDIKQAEPHLLPYERALLKSYNECGNFSMAELFWLTDHADATRVILHRTVVGVPVMVEPKRR